MDDDGCDCTQLVSQLPLLYQLIKYEQTKQKNKSARKKKMNEIMIIIDSWQSGEIKKLISLIVFDSPGELVK